MIFKQVRIERHMKKIVNCMRLKMHITGILQNTIMNVEVEKFENSGEIDFIEESRL